MHIKLSFKNPSFPISATLNILHTDDRCSLSSLSLLHSETDQRLSMTSSLCGHPPATQLLLCLIPYRVAQLSSVPSPLTGSSLSLIPHSRLGLFAIYRKAHTPMNQIRSFSGQERQKTTDSKALVISSLFIKILQKTSFSGGCY